MAQHTPAGFRNVPGGSADKKSRPNIFDQFDPPAAQPAAPRSPAIPEGFRVVSPPSSQSAQSGPWNKYRTANTSPPVKTNVFDQFDPPTQKKANVFDQFDPPAAPADRRIEFDGNTYTFPADATDDEIAEALESISAANPSTAPEQPTAGPWTKYAPAKPDEPSVLLDTGASFAAGVPRGVVETVMAPVTLGRLAQDGLDYGYEKAEDGIRALLGLDPITSEQRAAETQFRRDNSLDSSLFDFQDWLRGQMDAVLYKPKTTAGEFAQTIGEFAAPGGIPSKVARSAPTVGGKAARYAGDSIGNVFAPALLSETAGQLTEGSDWEGAARMVGAVTGNLGTAAARSFNAPEAAVRSATRNVTDQQWDEARRLADNATGVRLSGPEAIAQATGGASAMPRLLRTVEGSAQGNAVTAPFFAQRPGQVDNAVTEILDLIAPQSAAPSALGARAAQTADAVIDNARRDINTQTRPAYRAAEGQRLPADEYARISEDPSYQAALGRLRGNPEMAPRYAALPDDTVAVVDAVTKDLFARGEALANRANPLYGPELGMRNSAAGAEARNVARSTAPAYDQALREQEEMRRLILEPLEHGPVGRLSRASDTREAAEAILPRNPLSGSQGEHGDAMRRLLAQDPDATTQLVRQNLADRYNTARTETQGGNIERAGAKFRQDVAGNQTRAEVLDAVLRGLPDNGAAANRADELLEILQATQHRPHVGSATAFNQQLMDSLSGASSPAALAADVVKSFGTLITGAGDAVRRARYGGNIETLADLFTSPDTVDRIRAASQRGPRVGIDDALRRSAAQAGSAI